MAKLPDEIITIIFIQRQIVEGVNEAAATESMIFEQFGETEATLPVLEQLQNVRERLIGPYSRLSALLPRITDMLNLLYKTVEQAQAAHNASVASVREAKIDFDLS